MLLLTYGFVVTLSAFQYFLQVETKTQQKCPPVPVLDFVEFTCFENSISTIPSPCVTSTTVSIRNPNPKGSRIEVKCSKYYKWENENLQEKIVYMCEDSGWKGPIPIHQLKCRIRCGESFSDDFRSTNSSVNRKHLHDFSWQVAIYLGNNYTCAGTLINPTENNLIVLTAASCFQNQTSRPSQYSVLIGALVPEIQQDDKSSHFQILQVKRIIQHEHYDPFENSNNIALVLTKEPIQLNEFSLPICLPRNYTFNARHEGKTIVRVLNPNMMKKLLPKHKWAYAEIISIRTTYDCGNTTAESILSSYGCNFEESRSTNCFGDGGEGVIFPEADVTKSKWFIMFIQYISTSSPGSYQCGYQRATPVQKHLSWILRKIRAYPYPTSTTIAPTDPTTTMFNFPVNNQKPKDNFTVIVSKGKANDESATTDLITIVVQICITVLLIMLAIIGVVAFSIYYKRKNILTRTEIDAFLNGDISQRNEESLGNLLDVVPYNKSVEIEKSDLTIDMMTILGVGTFGIVFKGIYKDEPVAVKTIKAGSEKEYIRSLLSELKVMIYLSKHPNLVSLIGALTKYIRQGTLYLVVEYCPGGSLHRYLTEHRNEFLTNYRNSRSETSQENLRLQSVPSSFTSDQLLRWAYQICSAMEYLECKKVVHADLASRNVLLTETLNAKVSDFGLSRKLYQYTNYIKKHQEPLPWRWMAIESLTRLEFSHKSDVWAFGVTLYELYSIGDVPYSGMSYTLHFPSKLSDGMRMPKPLLASDFIFKMMEKSWAKDPNDRPYFSGLKIDLMNEISKRTAEVYTDLGVGESLHSINQC